MFTARKKSTQQSDSNLLQGFADTVKRSIESSGHGLRAEKLCFCREKHWPKAWMSKSRGVSSQPTKISGTNQSAVAPPSSCFFITLKATCQCVESPQGVISQIFHKLCSLNNSQCLDRQPVLKTPENENRISLGNSDPTGLCVCSIHTKEILSADSPLPSTVQSLAKRT